MAVSPLSARLINALGSRDTLLIGSGLVVEDERLQRLAEAKAQIQALTADEESDSDAA